MNIERLNLKWYVLDYDFNSDAIIKFNIFNSSKFNDCVNELIKKYSNFTDFKEKLKKDLMYCFWSKSEYEIVVGGLFAKEDKDLFKIDVYEQVLPNLDILVDYIINEVNKKKRKKLTK